MRPIACFPGLAVLAFMAVSGCSGPQTCSSDADCPTGSTCDVELSACFAVSEEDVGTDGGEPDAGNSDSGVPDAGELDAGVATFTLGVTPENPEVVQGESVQLQVAIERIGGFAEDVVVTLEDLPVRNERERADHRGDGVLGDRHGATTGETPVGPANIVVRASGGDQEQELPLSIAVKPSPVLTVDITFSRG